MASSQERNEARLHDIEPCRECPSTLCGIQVHLAEIAIPAGRRLIWGLGNVLFEGILAPPTPYAVTGQRPPATVIHLAGAGGLAPADELPEGPNLLIIVPPGGIALAPGGGRAAPALAAAGPNLLAAAPGEPLRAAAPTGRRRLPPCAPPSFFAASPRALRISILSFLSSKAKPAASNMYALTTILSP